VNREIKLKEKKQGRGQEGKEN